jgi:hypothetical protein
MHSRGHRANIISPAFTELGVGYAVDRAGRPYYVQVFASPLSSSYTSVREDVAVQPSEHQMR